MGKVIITLRVLPEDQSIEINNLLEKINEKISKIGGKYLQHYLKPIAFGISALEIKFVYPDKEFKEEEFIEEINSIEGISSAEIVNVTLSSL
ncbi:elongation factor 1-beta [Nanoarchaeota archaeon NZ13-N]|uniref:Elongation factor 1-beta n=1 Tax=Candidatus Nanoclepta minutus TaxID=1940235 RepID=A0A397WR89_9ARCH|nr:MAG: elongation factor 1-beta [Nanoarchaeota archaeon NZ13-N]RIB35186.1 MAG: hypothetical protein BXU00_02550 [Candidatus Nanoclepta minutus]